MQIHPISTITNQNSQLSGNSGLNFKTKLNLTFSPYDIPCNYNRGECNFARVISRFREWLSEQYPHTETLTIRKKFGNMVPQRKIGYAGASYTEQRAENLEFSMEGGKSGFCWNEQSGEDNALQDLKNTFYYVKEQAGW